MSVDKTLPIELYYDAKKVLAKLCEWCGKLGSNDCTNCSFYCAFAELDTSAPKEARPARPIVLKGKVE